MKYKYGNYIKLKFAVSLVNLIFILSCSDSEIEIRDQLQHSNSNVMLWDLWVSQNKNSSITRNGKISNYDDRAFFCACVLEKLKYTLWQ